MKLKHLLFSFFLKIRFLENVLFAAIKMPASFCAREIAV